MKDKKQHKTMQGHSSKSPPKKGMLTITEMFKKQTPKRNVNLVKDESNFTSAIDEDDVIVIGGDTISPYFMKPVSSNTSTDSCKVKNDDKVQLTRKRKLSLRNNDKSKKQQSCSHSGDVSDEPVSIPRKRGKLSLTKRGERIKSDQLQSVLTNDDSTEEDVIVMEEQDVSQRKELKAERNNGQKESSGSQDSVKRNSSPEIKENKYDTCTKTHNEEEQVIDKSFIPNAPSISEDNSSDSPFYKSPSSSSQGRSECKNADHVKENISCSADIGISVQTKITRSDSVDDYIKCTQIEDNDSNVAESQEMKEEEKVDESESNADVSSEPQYRVPYYLSNFETILETVMVDKSNADLFNADDMQIITTYQQLSDAAKKLYIRMFSRKLHWITLGKLNYPEIADDLKPHLQELAEAKFIDCDENLTDLEEVLNSLSAGDIKTLAKSYHIASNVTSKSQLVQELLKKSQQSTISSMFGAGVNGVAKSMLAKAKKYLNGIYRLKAEPRKVFVRVMMLFSLVNTSYDEESGTSGQGQLFQLLMVNMGKVIYPTYTVEKIHNVFQTREDVIRFEQALQLESDLMTCTERGKWDEAFDIFKTVEKEWESLQADENTVKWNESLPDFLRSFTATSVVCRLLSASVEIIQRRKDYAGAVDLLHRLLAQTTYQCSHRGYWWERLALNLDAHLKQPLQSLEAVAEGLADSYVRTGHRYALYLRAENICNRQKLKISHRLKEFEHEVVRQLPKVYIEGRVLHEGVSTNGTRFLTAESYADGNAQDMTVCGVEQFVLDYYKRNGFPSGIHAEGSIVTMLFALFFWDIIFLTVPDAFHSPFQAVPLDFRSNMFYERRKEAIERRLAELETTSVEDLQLQAEEIWTSKNGIMCVGLNWDRLSSFDWVKDLLSCMGGKVLSGLVGRYARCPRHTGSGFPDLTLWNAETGALKICEVKGPGDRLSNKQILWINHLLSLGVDAEVCHVKAVAAKRLRPSLR